jgi:hypothetical protein
MSGKIAGKNKTRRSPKLTRRQLGVVKAKLANPDISMADAARKAGYSTSSEAALASAGSKAMKSANVRERFLAAMEGRKKLSDEALLEKLEEGLEARVTKFFSHEGRVVDQEDCIDFPTRGSYLTLAAKLKGLEVNKTEVTGAGGAALIPDSSPAVAALTKEDLLRLIAAMDSLPQASEKSQAIKEGPASTGSEG